VRSPSSCPAPPSAKEPLTKDEVPKDAAPKHEVPKDAAPKDEVPKDEALKDEVLKDEARKEEALAPTILPALTSSHRFRSPSCCPAWPAPNEDGANQVHKDANQDGAKKVHEEDVAKDVDVEMATDEAHVDTKVIAPPKAQLPLLTDSHHLRSPSS